MTEWRDRKAVARQKVLFPQAVLSSMKDLALRKNIHKLSCRFDRSRRNIFKLKRHHINALSKSPHLKQIVITLTRLDIRDLPRRRVAFRRKRMHAIPHLARLDRKHATELAAAKNADC